MTNQLDASRSLRNQSGPFLPWWLAVLMGCLPGCILGLAFSNYMNGSSKTPVALANQPHIQANTGYAASSKVFRWDDLSPRGGSFVVEGKTYLQIYGLGFDIYLLRGVGDSFTGVEGSLFLAYGLPTTQNSLIAGSDKPTSAIGIGWVCTRNSCEPPKTPGTSG